jgi:mRNA-degrading endonuclease RelE of RelBE toxin-antitoxin system
MTDRINKELAKLSTKEHRLVKEILLKLRRGDSKNLQIAKLKGSQDIYRVRKGRLRIIYQQGPIIKAPS